MMPMHDYTVMGEDLQRTGQHLRSPGYVPGPWKTFHSLHCIKSLHLPTEASRLGAVTQLTGDRCEGPCQALRPVS